MLFHSKEIDHLYSLVFGCKKIEIFFGAIFSKTTSKRHSELAGGLVVPLRYIVHFSIANHEEMQR